MITVCATCKWTKRGKDVFSEAIFHCEDHAHTVIIKFEEGENGKEPQIIVMKGIK